MITRELGPRVAGVGDIVSDVQGLFALTQAQNAPGGIQGYFADLYQQFANLPNEVRRLQMQITAVNAVLAANHADSTALSTAQRDTAQITAQLPGVQQRVQKLFAVLGPILPQLQAGDLTQDVISTLALRGSDVVDTVQQVQQLFKARDDAAGQLQNAVNNPQLSPAVAQQAADALAGGSFDAIASSPIAKALLIGVAGFIAYKIIRGR